MADWVLGRLGNGWEQAGAVVPVQPVRYTHVEDVSVVVVVVVVPLLLPMGLFQNYCRQSGGEWAADNAKELLIVQVRKKHQNREANLSLPEYLGHMLSPRVLHGFASDVLLLLLYQ